MDAAATTDAGTGTRTLNTIGWVDLVTGDVAAAASFYGELLGWSVDEAPLVDGGPFRMVRRGDSAVAGMLELTPALRDRGVGPRWQPYVLVADIEGMAERARSLGADVLVEPSAVGDGGMVAWIVDPTGAAISLWRPGRHQGADLFDQPGALTWAELRTRDLDAARQFYGELLGWSTVRQDIGEMPYSAFHVDGRGVAGLMGMDGMGDEVPPRWNVVFAVDDAARAAAITSSNGGTVWSGPQELPVGTVVSLADPEGVELALVQRS